MDSRFPYNEVTCSIRNTLHKERRCSRKFTRALFCFSNQTFATKEKIIMRKLFPLFSLIVVASIMMAGCGTPVSATPVTVEVTRVVTVEVPVAAETPSGEAQPTAVPPVAPVAGGERLQAVLDRGQLICGVHGTFQGFGFVDSAGAWTGFDVDFCRAWAAALFNDANAVE